MIRHIVFTKFNDPDRNVPEAMRLLRALPARIPEIRSLEVGRDVLKSERSWDMALTVTVDDLAALARYTEHEAHLLVRAYIKANRSASATVDYEVE